MRRSGPWVAGTALAAAVSAALAQPPEDAATRGLAIARAAHAANRGFASERATLAMELVNPYGEVTKRRLTIETLEAREDGDRSKVTFLSPADVKGTQLLTWTHRSRDDDQWLYLPALRRVKRIAAAEVTGSFMGSELSYEDLAGTEVEKFSYRFLDAAELEGRAASKLERVPRSRASGYGREVVWLDEEYQNPLRIEYYDRAGALLKVATFAGYRRHGRLWRAESVAIENVQTKKRTILRWEQRELPAGLASEAFDSARLGD